MKPYFSDAMQTLLRQVHINMPIKVLPKYLEMILHYRLNVELGFEAVELDRMSGKELSAVAGKLHGRNCRISLHGPFWDLSTGSVDPLIRKVSYSRFQQLFETLDIFRPVQVVLHTGFDPRHHRGHRRAWLDNSMAIWEPLVKRAEGLNIPLLLENVWERDPELHLELFGRIDSSFFGFCLDVGHQHSFSGTALSVWLEALWHVLREIHVHDNDGSRDAHLPVGRGSIDFALLFDFLKARNLTPLLTLEPHLEEHLPESLSGLMRVMTACGTAWPVLS